MKVVCDCENEVNLVEPNDGEDRINSEYGVYVIQDKSTFDFWERHDEVGIVCNKCQKSIFMFT